MRLDRMSPSFRNLFNRVNEGYSCRAEISEGAGGLNPLNEGEYMRPLGPGLTPASLPAPANRFAHDFASPAHNKH
jgi:hypothetical protein